MNPFSKYLAKFLQRPVSRVGLRDEPQNLGSSATVATIQSAIRLAEAGDTKQLFTLYRDSLLGDTHIQAEFGKRKMAVLSEPHSIQPADKKNAEDVIAATVVEDMIAGCENWTDGLIALMDATLWPVTVLEKVFAPSTEEPRPGRRRLQYALKKLCPINPTLLCFREPYGRKDVKDTAGAAAMERWEPHLRIYTTDAEGRINWSEQSAYHCDPGNHIVHRGHLLVGMRDNFGGPFRAILFWWFLRGAGREWFARLMERYGSPFPVGKVDSANQEAITFLQEAFSLSTKIGGLVVDHDTEVELMEAAVNGGADAHEKFRGVCNREISLAIVGQELSSTAKATGMGSGVAQLQGQVRDDIAAFDKLKLAEVLARQLFEQFLFINGIPGRTPKISWGTVQGEEAQLTGALLQGLALGGLRPTDEALPILSEKFGFPIERAPVVNAEPSPSPGRPGGKKVGGNDDHDFPPSDGEGDKTDRVETFSAQRMLAEDIGVPVAWLAPVREAMARIEAKVKDKSATDADLLDFLEEAAAKLPELFGKMDKDALARIFEAGMGGATLEGMREGMKR